MPCRWLERVVPRARISTAWIPGQELKEFLEGDFRANIELKTINRWDVGSVESSDTYLSCATQPFASQADLSQEPMASLQQPVQLVRPRFLQGVRTKARFDPVDATRALRPDTIELPRPEPHVFAPSATHKASPFSKVMTLFGGQSGRYGGAGDPGMRPEQHAATASRGAAKSILKKPEERTTASTGTATTPSLGALCVHTVDVMCSPVRAERTPLLTAQEDGSPAREPRS